jgi:cytidylate kinase
VSAAHARGFILAIDGPGGVGKSTVSRRVARRLGLRYLDTGAMYRAVTWALLRHGVRTDDPTAVADAAAGVRLEVGTDPARPTIHADGVDVGVPIRTREVTAAVSAVSAVPGVRALLLDQQRLAIADGGIVVEGRDIGTVVVPDAPLKVFLTADADVRAQRRGAELRSHDGTAVATVRRELARRDAFDSSRAVSPLTAAEDAVVVDTTELSIDEVVERVLCLAIERGAEHDRG